MAYHLNRDGQNLGIFPLEELSRRRVAGELDGTETVWCEGMANWESLDTVLAKAFPGLVGRKSNRSFGKLVAMTVVLAVLATVAAALLILVIFRNHLRHRLHAYTQIEVGQAADSSRVATVRMSALEAASKPVVWTTNTLFPADVMKKSRDFRLRQYLEGYKLRGERNPSYDADAIGLIQNWVAATYGGTVDTSLPPLEQLAEKLANNQQCDDGVVLIAAAANTSDRPERRRRAARAVEALKNSKHLAYPKLYAAAFLAGELDAKQDFAEVNALDSSLPQLLAACFKDGSVTPDDQQELARAMLTGSLQRLYTRQTSEFENVVNAAGPAFHWLALVNEGRAHIQKAWRFRGNGTADTVTAQGGMEFERQLGLARDCLTPAWKLHPEFALAAELMMRVNLGASGIGEIRTWFDRAVAAEFEDPAAWTEMRWALRTRWYGDVESELAFGATALNTGRFDTDVPRGFYECLTAAEDDMRLNAGQHIYDREDVWPNIQKLYEGYIRQTADYPETRDSWRSTYIAFAFVAGKYNVARKQLESLNWSPNHSSLAGWGHDLSLLNGKVAAMTGSAGPLIQAAELAFEHKDITRAIYLYTDLQSITNADDRTREFIKERLTTLHLEEQLQKGGWVDIMPADTNLSGWAVDYGKAVREPDGALEVACGPYGHILFSRARVGPNFEVQGEFDIVKSTTKEFRAGLVVGLPQWDSYNWYSFRMRRSGTEGDLAALSRQYKLQQVAQKVALRESKNTFQFKIYENKVTASVNDQPVFENAVPPQTIFIPDDEFRVGVGANNDNNDTMVRYRKLQVRKVR